MYKHRLFLVLLTLTLLLCTSPLTTYAAEADTDETSENAYMETIHLYTVEDLLTFADSCRLDIWSLDRLVVLEADLDLTGTDFVGIPTFGGTFEGNDYTIRGLSLTKEGDVQGFFRYLQPTALVQNLNIEGAITPSGASSTLGGIAGTNGGSLLNCTFSGNVAGADNIGGLVGCNEVTGILEDCHVFGTIQGSHFAGGLAGDNHGVIRSCTNQAEINTTASNNTVSLEDITLDNLTNSEAAYTATDMGGIAGTSSGVIRSCINYGNVGYKSMSYNAGGIAGSLTGYLVDCENYGVIYARKDVGGIVGQLEPSNVIEYDEDTLQILNAQLNSLGSLAQRTGSHASSGSQEINSQLSNLQSQNDNAKNAVGAMLGEFKIDGELPDPDTLTAARSDLSSNLNGMTGTMEGLSTSVTNMAGTMVNDIKAIFSQMQRISSTLSHAEDNLGVTMSDISDLDTDEDTLSKIASCVNYGQVHADQNGGGIVGTISLENDLDPEDDVEISGDLSLNLSYETRAVTRYCTNYAEVQVKNWNAGGIVGNMGTGAVLDCVNLGSMTSTTAKRVGGIAGSSSTILRRCDVKCALSGQSQVGGIAGIGSTVTDCRTLVQINSDGPEIGAVLGSSSSAMSLQTLLSEEERAVSANYYLAPGKDIGAIDGISYSTCAEPLSLTDFLAIEDLPEYFTTMTIRFVCEDQEDIVFHLPLGEAFPAEQIPQVPALNSYNGQWDGLADSDLSAVWFDHTFHAAYTAYRTTLQSEDTRANGLPIVLTESSFPDGTTLEIETTVKSATLPEGATLVESWQLSVDSESELTVHYLPPEDLDPEALDIYVQDALGAWTKRTYHIDGSYVVFSMAQDEFVFCAFQQPADYTALYLAAGGTAILIALVITVVVIKKRHRAKAQPSVSTEQAA